MHLGTSEDGLHFRMDDELVLPPGPDPDDRDGCEDPTVVGHDTGCAVFYSGWNQEAEEGRLLWASSRGDVTDVDKRGRVLPEPNRYINAKETALIRAADGSWRMFFEYANGRSLIGVAEARALTGLGHHSLTPAAPEGTAGTPGTSAPARSSRQGRRIGWVQLSPDCRSIAARGAEPTVLPHGITGDDTRHRFRRLGGGRRRRALALLLGQRQEPLSGATRRALSARSGSCRHAVTKVRHAVAEAAFIQQLERQAHPAEGTACHHPQPRAR